VAKIIPSLGSKVKRLSFCLVRSLKDEAVSDDCSKLSSFSNDLRLPYWNWKPNAVLPPLPAQRQLHSRHIS